MQTVRYSIVEKVLDVPLENQKYPNFMLGGYKTNFSTHTAEHAVLYYPDLETLQNKIPLVRINSACFTGDIFHDQRCDCNEQLLKAMELIKNEPGLIIYHLHHEGRGLGLVSKLATYKQMAEEGISTFEAMERIVNKNDLRTYGSALLILNDLKIKRLKLITNNPNKKEILEKNGIEVVDVIGSVSQKPSLKRYLKSKAEEQNHMINHLHFDMLDAEDELK